LLACDWYLKYTAAYAHSLRRAGADVALVSRGHALEFGGDASERDRVFGELRREGVQILVLPGRISSIAGLRPMLAARRAVRRWRPDVVHVQENHDPRLWFVTHGFPRVLTIHDPTPHHGAPTLSVAQAFVFRAWLHSVDRVIVHGDRLRARIPFRLAQRVAVVPHGTAPADRPLPPPQEKSVLLFGRLEAYKGVRTLRDAMEIVWGTRPDVRLLVYGAGPEARHLANDARIEKSIGYVPEEAVDTVFARASLVVLPYLGGSQSGVGAHAVGRGIPTIVSDVGALPELALSPEFVVPPGDAASLAAAILRHVDHDHSLRQAVLRFAQEKLAWDAVARTALDVYRDLLQAKWSAA
jgi:alpha-maltose-1-phosphate synthase